MTVARTKPALAWGAVIIRPLQKQRPQHALKGLPVATMILGWSSAGARQFGTGVIAGIGIQPLFERSCGQTQRLAPSSHLDGFEIQVLD